MPSINKPWVDTSMRSARSTAANDTSNLPSKVFSMR